MNAATILLLAAVIVPPTQPNSSPPSNLQEHPPFHPPKDSEFDPAYRAVITKTKDGISISPAPVYQLPKVYIDVDVTESGGMLALDAPPFAIRPGEKFIAAGEIVIRFVNPIEKRK